MVTLPSTLHLEHLGACQRLCELELPALAWATPGRSSLPLLFIIIMGILTAIFLMAELANLFSPYPNGASTIGCHYTRATSCS